MNKFTFATCLLVVAIVSFVAGRNTMSNEHEKDYQAACILSDCCRNMVDNIGVDAEEIYGEYVDNLDCYPDIIVTREELLNNYAWMY